MYLDIVVDNFVQHTPNLNASVNHLLQSSIWEGLGNAAGIDHAHGVIGAILWLTSNGPLHSYASVENNIDEGGNGKDISNGCENRIFSWWMPGKGTILLNKSFKMHILKGSFFCHNEKAIWVTEGVFGGMNIDVTEFWHYHPCPWYRRSCPYNVGGLLDLWYHQSWLSSLWGFPWQFWWLRSHIPWEDGHLHLPQQHEQWKWCGS